MCQVCGALWLEDALEVYGEARLISLLRQKSVLQNSAQREMSGGSG